MNEQAEKSAVQLRKRYTADERAQIRDTLIAYMERSAIGVPTLQKEIAIANDVVLDRIPLSTLQRFLANSHRTNDSFIGFCERLASALPAADPLSAFARSVSAIFGSDEDGTKEAAPPLSAGQTLTGYVQAYTGKAEGVRVFSRNDLHKDFTRSPYCRLDISGAGQGPALRLFEQIINWKQEAEADQAEPVARPCEGIGLMRGERFFALLKNQLTGAPRTYWMEPRQGWILAGDIIEMRTALDGDDQVLHSTVAVGLDAEKGPDHAGT